MSELVMNKIAQAILFVVGWGFYMWAELGNTEMGLFQEAAKYGIAVLVLCIVLFILYKEYREEKKESKEEIRFLNKLITEMVDANRKSLERSTASIENITKELKRFNSVSEKLIISINEMNKKD